MAIGNIKFKLGVDPRYIELLEELNANPIFKYNDNSIKHHKRKQAERFLVEDAIIDDTSKTLPTGSTNRKNGEKNKGSSKTT